MSIRKDETREEYNQRERERRNQRSSPEETIRLDADTVSESAPSKKTAGRPKKPAKPSPQGASYDESDEFIKACLGLVTLLIGLWLANGNMESGLLDTVAMQADEIQAIAAPLAKIFTKSELNKRVGKRITESIDWLAALMAVISYGTRIKPLIDQKLSQPRAKGIKGNGKHFTSTVPESHGQEIGGLNGYFEQPYVPTGYQSN